MKEYTHQQWLDKLKNRFGENVMDWAFKCPACGKVSTIREFIDAGAEIHDSYQNCIGRFNGKGKPYLDGKGSYKDGCDWAAYGLFGTLSKGDIVITENGNRIKVFPMASPRDEEIISAQVLSADESCIVLKRRSYSQDNRLLDIQ